MRCLRSCYRRFVPEVSVGLEAGPLPFVDFLREPTVDLDTGEVKDANPSYYEATSSLTSLR